MANYICKTCRREYQKLGNAARHAERIHNVAPPMVVDTFWRHRLTPDGWIPAQVGI